MKVVWTILLVIFCLFTEVAFVEFTVNAITNWREKGEEKKLWRVTFIIVVASFPFFYLMTILFN